MPSQMERLFVLRMKDLFLRFSAFGRVSKGFFLSEAEKIDSLDPELFEYLPGYIHLTPSSVEQNQIGEIIPPLFISPQQHLVHHAVIIGALDRSDLEMEITLLYRTPIFKGDHGSHRVPALEVRDVKGLDPSRDSAEVESLLQLFKDLPLSFPDPGLRCVELFRVFTGHLNEVLPISSHRNEDPDLLPLEFGKPRLDHPLLGNR